MRRQGVMCGQEMGRRNVSSGHVCAVRNVSSQCVVSVTAKSDTQDAGALYIYIYIYAYIYTYLTTCSITINPYCANHCELCFFTYTYIHIMYISVCNIEINI